MDSLAPMVGESVRVRMMKGCEVITGRVDLLALADAGIIVGKIKTVSRGLSGQPTKLAESSDHRFLPWGDILSVEA